MTGREISFLLGVVGLIVFPGVIASHWLPWYISASISGVALSSLIYRAGLHAPRQGGIRL